MAAAHPAPEPHGEGPPIAAESVVSLSQANRRREQCVRRFYLRPLAGARRAIPRIIHGARVAITSTARSERRIAMRRSGVGADASSASADPARGPWRSTAKSCQLPGTPRSSTLPRSSKLVPEPTTRSRTVRETRMSPAPAWPRMRAAFPPRHERTADPTARRGTSASAEGRRERRRLAREAVGELPALDTGKTRLVSIATDKPVLPQLCGHGPVPALRAVYPRRGPPLRFRVRRPCEELTFSPISNPAGLRSPCKEICDDRHS